MPMIDVYAGAGVFDDKEELARSRAAAVMVAEEGRAHTNAELVAAARRELPSTVET
jgi:hypothetical protein